MGLFIPCSHRQMLLTDEKRIIRHCPRYLLILHIEFMELEKSGALEECVQKDIFYHVGMISNKIEICFAVLCYCNMSGRGHLYFLHKTNEKLRFDQVNNMNSRYTISKKKFK